MWKPVARDQNYLQHLCIAGYVLTTLKHSADANSGNVCSAAFDFVPDSCNNRISNLHIFDFTYICCYVLVIFGISICYLLAVHTCVVIYMKKSNYIIDFRAWCVRICAWSVAFYKKQAHLMYAPRSQMTQGEQKRLAGSHSKLQYARTWLRATLDQLTARHLTSYWLCTHLIHIRLLCCSSACQPQRLRYSVSFFLMHLIYFLLCLSTAQKK